jgi:hypothetical protein
MKCPKCGLDNPDDARFCGQCGAPMPVAPLPPDHGPAGEVPSNLNIGIIAGSVLIPLLGIIMGAIYMNDPSPAKRKAGKLWLYVGIGVMVAQCLLGCLFGMISNMASGGGTF